MVAPAGIVAAAGGAGAAGGPIEPGGSITGAPPPPPAPTLVPAGTALLGVAGVTMPGCAAAGATPPAALAATGAAPAWAPPVKADDGLAGAGAAVDGIPPPIPAPADSPCENAAAGEPPPTPEVGRPLPAGSPLPAPGIWPMPLPRGFEPIPRIPPPRPLGIFGIPPDPKPPPLPRLPIPGIPPPPRGEAAGCRGACITEGACVRGPLAGLIPSSPAAGTFPPGLTPDCAADAPVAGSDGDSDGFSLSRCGFAVRLRGSLSWVIPGDVWSTGWTGGEAGTSPHFVKRSSALVFSTLFLKEVCAPMAAATPASVW
ncbi:hypothetical protein Mycch_6042 (plasmid) [Mycolicibacterium chubuense NBB4]|uniref:Uncharacterized protein n=1 Tax=Mycolicibacterium chubuense (strain NBB4) TaxID=710421 RepID=I4BTN5_MYCCN|nr:hypothetical protein Mycch_6042 [Mycolicibacterium chubuense NBB4]